MTGLLMIHAILLLFAVKRGWRALPFAVLALPHLLGLIEPLLPAFAFAGWQVPFANVALAVAAACTGSLIYTAIANPEPA